MKNLFHPGQSIAAMTEYELQTGGLYVFIYQGEITIHRLMKIRNDKLVFKGDMSLLSEEVLKSDVLGRVMSSGEKFFQYLSGFYKKNNPFILRGSAKVLILISSKFIPKPV